MHSVCRRANRNKYLKGYPLKQRTDKKKENWRQVLLNLFLCSNVVCEAAQEVTNVVSLVKYGKISVASPLLVFGK